MTKTLVAWCFIGASLILGSCQIDKIQLDKIKAADISPSIAIKLGTRTFTVEEFIADLEDDKFEVEEEDDLLITFVYTEEFSFDDVAQIIEVGSVSNTASFSFGIDIPGLPISQTVPFDDEFNFKYETPNGEIIDSAFYKSGTLIYDMTSSYPASIDYQWVVLDMKELTTSEDLTQGAFLQYEGARLTENSTNDLTNYKSIIREKDGVNTFDVTVAGDLIIEPNVALLSSQSIDFELTFQDPVFSALYGYFGSETVVLDDILFELDFLDEFRSELDNVLYFAEPSITFEIENSFGIELELDFSEISAVAVDGSVVNMQTTLTDKDMLVQAPDYSQIGESVTTTIRIDAVNSSIDELLSSLPTQILFPIETTPNPESSDLEKNFLTDSSTINVTATIELPLNLRMNSYTREFDTELDELDLEDIINVEIVVGITSELPFDGVVNLEFLDDDGNSIYVLEDEILFNSPAIDTDGRTEDAELTESRVALSEEVIEVIKDARIIRSIVTLSSREVDEETNVKIYSDYEMTLDLGITGEVNIAL